MSFSQTFSELNPSTSRDNLTPNPTKIDTSPSPIRYSLMEFALQNFKTPNKRSKKILIQIYVDLFTFNPSSSTA